jgi:hypothetical protein
MALTASKLKIKTPSSLKEFSLYSSTGDMITPLEPLPVRVNGATVYASLYPPKSITGNNVYIQTKGKKYQLKENNTVPIPATWTNAAVPWGLGSDIAAGNGIFMYVGVGRVLSNTQEYRCYTSTNGVNWTQKTNPLASSAYLVQPFLAFHNGYFYCGKVTGGSLVRSTDGNSWSAYNPSGIQSGNVINMAVNCWNQKFAYFIGKSSNPTNQLALTGESANQGASAQQNIQAYPTDPTSYFMFWGKHFYVFGGEILRHLDSTNSGTSPAVDSNIALSSVFPYSGVFFMPFGNKTYGLYRNTANDVYETKSTADGYAFVYDSMPFSTPAVSNIENVILSRGEDVSRRLGIISSYNSSSDNYTWYAYDHMAGTNPVSIISSPNEIESLVSANGIYLAQERGGATSGAQRLWTAAAP